MDWPANRGGGMSVSDADLDAVARHIIARLEAVVPDDYRIGDYVEPCCSQGEPHTWHPGDRELHWIAVRSRR